MPTKTVLPETETKTMSVRQEIEAALGTVDEVMERTVTILRPDQSVGEAARDLERRGVSGAPVVEHQRVVGVVSLRDLFEEAGIPVASVVTSGPWHRYEHHLDGSKRKVAEAMTRTVVTVAPGTPISSVANLMRERKVNRIPVVDARGIVRGIVARDEIIQAVAGIFG